ncbi:hypothetical protein CRE_02358 [Caenorhabditis remanei]|uniref:Uncharacterized protein n=1 Tax=Caenorhabditis remanei TaxID=31234 RepID=E3MIR9_CAERE|nr:hypothetical protein CRE_02358 [Caenorhabditis remanei]
MAAATSSVLKSDPSSLEICIKAAVSASDATEKMDCEEFLNVTDDTVMMVAESTAPTTIDGPRVAMEHHRHVPSDLHVME